jgi:hypothetical protein
MELYSYIFVKPMGLIHPANLILLFLHRNAITTQQHSSGRTNCPTYERSGIIQSTFFCLIDGMHRYSEM